MVLNNTFLLTPAGDEMLKIRLPTNPLHEKANSQCKCRIGRIKNFMVTHRGGGDDPALTETFLQTYGDLTPSDDIFNRKELRTTCLTNRAHHCNFKRGLKMMRVFMTMLSSIYRWRSVLAYSMEMNRQERKNKQKDEYRQADIAIQNDCNMMLCRTGIFIQRHAAEFTLKARYSSRQKMSHMKYDRLGSKFLWWSIRHNHDKKTIACLNEL